MDKETKATTKQTLESSDLCLKAQHCLHIHIGG